MTGASRPLPGCPARTGTTSFGIDGAEFVYHAGDCANNGNPVTEIFGFFCPPARQQPGNGDDDDSAVHTAAFEVPAGSLVSRLARQADTTAGITRIGEELRAAIAGCPCHPGGQCAALDETAFLAAIEHAAKPARPARRRTRGLWHE